MPPKCIAHNLSFLYNEGMNNTNRTRSYPVVQVLSKTVWLAIPIVILFVVVSWFSFSEIRRQNNLAVENAVNIYQTELEHKLSAIKHFVQWTVVHDPILDSFNTDGHMGEFRQASNDLRLRVSDMQYSTGSEYQYFFYWDEGDIFFNASELKLDYDTYKAVKAKITSDVKREGGYPQDSSWAPLEIRGRTYLYYLITYKHRTFVAMVSIEDMLSPLSSLNLGEHGNIRVQSPIGGIFYQTGERPSGFEERLYDSLIFPGEESGLPFTLLIDAQILGNYGTLFILQFAVFLAALMLSFIMGGYILLTYRKVILPIKLFSEGLKSMGSLEEGEAAELELTDSRIQELNQINDQFKNLIHEITRLRIDVYEAELDKNKFRIHFLQQQIKPHFYLNCLTTIDSMVSLGDLDAAQKMLQFTSRYFRYLFQADKDFVPLGNELDHISDYLAIQNMRLSRSTEYDLDVAKELLSAGIPPLLLITFIENSIKHASPAGGEPLHIGLICSKTEDDRLSVHITDNGQGFPADFLKKVYSGEQLEDNGDHIGITNCIRRMRLLYGDAFELSLENRPAGGASVIIHIPYSVQN